MYSIKELSKKANVSVRTLHYYDEIGLLCPAGKTESNYRMYDDSSFERLKLILIFKELQFPLAKIKEILDNGYFENEITNQISILNKKKEYIENLISFAKKYKTKGDVSNMKNDEYKNEVAKRWGNTKEYQEFQSKKVNSAKERILEEGLMNILKEFSYLKDLSSSDEKVLNLVSKYKSYISNNFYTCSDEMLLMLGQMYVNDERFLKNIDDFCGKGTAQFVFDAITEFCK